MVTKGIYCFMFSIRSRGDNNKLNVLLNRVLGSRKIKFYFPLNNEHHRQVLHIAILEFLSRDLPSKDPLGTAAVIRIKPSRRRRTDNAPPPPSCSSF